MADPTHPPGRTTGVVLLAAIFLMGMVCGAALFYLGQRSVGGVPSAPIAGRPGGAPGMGPGDPDRPRGDGPPIHGPLGEMARELQLDEQQRIAIRQILERYRGRINAMLEESRLEIRDVLTEEQRRRFDTMRPPHVDGPRGRHPGPRHGFRPRRDPQGGPPDPQGDPPPPPPE